MKTCELSLPQLINFPGATGTYTRLDEKKAAEKSRALKIRV